MKFVTLANSGRFNVSELCEQFGATRYGYDLGGRAVILMAGNGQVTANTYGETGSLSNCLTNSNDKFVFILLSDGSDLPCFSDVEIHCERESADQSS